jgi:hypothetical protein
MLSRRDLQAYRKGQLRTSGAKKPRKKGAAFNGAETRSSLFRELLKLGPLNIQPF